MSMERELAARLAADLVVVVHFAFVAFVLFGQLLVVAGGICGWRWVRNRWFRGLHVACIAVVVFEAWLGITCPLTTWERQLRHAAGQASYRGDFLAHWAHQLLFYNLPPHVFTIVYTLFGGLVLATLWLVPPRLRRGGANGRLSAT